MSSRHCRNCGVAKQNYGIYCSSCKSILFTSSSSANTAALSPATPSSVSQKAPTSFTQAAAQVPPVSYPAPSSNHITPGDIQSAASFVSILFGNTGTLRARIVAFEYALEVTKGKTPATLRHQLLDDIADDDDEFDEQENLTKRRK